MGTIDLNHGTVSAQTVKRVTATIPWSTRKKYNGVSYTVLLTEDQASVSNYTDLPDNLGLCGSRMDANGVLEVSLVNPTTGDIASGTIRYIVTIENFGGPH
jgi:hypothetical protein